jgi:hypothetical protein
MSSRRLHLILMGVLVLLFIGLLAGTYKVNKLLTSRADSLVALKARSQSLDEEQVILNKAQKDAARYEDLNKIAQAVVPQDKSQAEAVRQIVNIAADNGVTLASVTFPASTLGSLPGGSSVATTAASVPAAQAKTGSSKGANLSQLTALKNIPGVYQLPITISNDQAHPVQYPNLINFLTALEHNRRTSQVQTISINPAAKNPNNLIFSITLSEYIKP